jgi:hypothetical protein
VRAIEAAKSTVSPEEITEHLIAAAQHLAFVMQRLIDERKKSQLDRNSTSPKPEFNASQPEAGQLFNGKSSFDEGSEDPAF